MSSWSQSSCETPFRDRHAMATTGRLLSPPNCLKHEESYKVPPTTLYKPVPFKSFTHIKTGDQCFLSKKTVWRFLCFKIYIQSERSIRISWCRWWFLHRVLVIQVCESSKCTEIYVYCISKVFLLLPWGRGKKKGTSEIQTIKTILRFTSISYCQDILS
jgi:hypothetical protein